MIFNNSSWCGPISFILVFIYSLFLFILVRPALGGIYALFFCPVREEQSVFGFFTRIPLSQFSASILSYVSVYIPTLSLPICFWYVWWFISLLLIVSLEAAHALLEFLSFPAYSFRTWGFSHFHSSIVLREDWGQQVLGFFLFSFFFFRLGVKKIPKFFCCIFDGQSVVVC